MSQVFRLFALLMAVSGASSLSGESGTASETSSGTAKSSNVAPATSHANTIDTASLLWLWFVLGAGALVLVALVD